ncbi:MAG: isoprenylcysteine carboxylmethyltransferase family protein [Candidatus Verstraetearchaeota archaeon]|nr:isoprenylcysteine carboxylmethyltransferase family protein [Candidatus Verstraetearchaeota archaeon]
MVEAISPTKGKALLVVTLVVFVVVAVFFALGYLLTIAIGIPSSLGFAPPIRLIGGLVLALGFLFYGWLFRYRNPVDILVSTYVTISKVGRREPLEKPSGRKESLVVQGPYRYVRHPLYFGNVLLLIGWWLLLDYTFLLFSAVLLLLWFNFVVANFEEKELRAMFGEQYEQYSREVPKIIPFTKRRKRGDETQSGERR